MQKQARIMIHGKTSQKTAQILSKVLRKYKFVKVDCIEGMCIVSSDQIPDSLNTWLIDILLNSKMFLGKYHHKHPLYNRKRSHRLQEKFVTAISRFGFWESTDYPEDNVFFEYLVSKTRCLLNGMPLWKAVKIARDESGCQITLPDSPYAYDFKLSLIQNLVDYFAKSQEEALEIINLEFPEYKNAARLEMDNSNKMEIQKIMYNKIQELIGILKFYTPKERRKYIEQGDRMDKFLVFIFIMQSKGRQWVVDNIGEVEGWT